MTLKTTVKIIAGMTLTLVALGQGCARLDLMKGFDQDGNKEQSSSGGDVNTQGTNDVSVNTGSSADGPGVVVTNATAAYHKAILTGDQYLQSVFNLTGVPNDNGAAGVRMGYITSMGNFAVENEVSLITSPMLLSMGNTAGQVCQLAVNRETGLQAAQRRLFASVNFAGNPASNTAAFSEAYTKMATLFWGRAPDASELSLGQELITGVINQAAANDRTAVSTTTDVALAICAGLLSSVEVITF